MPELQYKICSFCKGVTHTETYKLNPKNFSTVRVEIISQPTSLPNTPPMPGHQHRMAIICNECMNSADNPIQPLLDVMTTAATNDAEISATINNQ